MKIIPVIDLKDGIVVSAKQGLRNNYQPINSTLCGTSVIEDIVDGFLSIYSFTTLYIADLNAITNTGNNQNLIDNIVSKYPTIEFWVDNGTKIQNILTNTSLNYRLVIGSECQVITNFENMADILKQNILSLDFFPDQGYKGPAELIENPKSWPQDIIIMSLDHVGKNAGPNMSKLKGFSQQYSDKNIIAAGGIRNEMDLLNLKNIGVNHALIASALHSGVITAEIIKKLISLE